VSFRGFLCVVVSWRPPVAPGEPPRRCDPTRCNSRFLAGLGHSVENDRENKRYDQLRLVGGIDGLALSATNSFNQPVAEEERESPHQKPQCGKPAALGESLHMLDDDEWLLDGLQVRTRMTRPLKSLPCRTTILLNREEEKACGRADSADDARARSATNPSGGRRGSSTGDHRLRRHGVVDGPRAHRPRSTGLTRAATRVRNVVKRATT